MAKTVEYFRDENAMMARAAALFRRSYAEAIFKKGFFSVILSGGRTPIPFFKELAAQKSLDWNKIFFFFSDERLAGRGGKESNFGTARKFLFSKSPIPAANIFAVPVSKGAGAAKAYEKMILTFFKGHKISFDLSLLGLGADGHTASLFLGGPALLEKKKLALAVTAPAYAEPRRRVTMTLKALNSAKTTVFLVSGKEKKEIFTALAAASKDLPASKIKPADNLYLFYAA
jgi:6-phosphogluconolactonase